MSASQLAEACRCKAGEGRNLAQIAQIKEVAGGMLPQKSL